MSTATPTKPKKTVACSKKVKTVIVPTAVQKKSTVKVTAQKSPKSVKVATDVKATKKAKPMIETQEKKAKFVLTGNQIKVLKVLKKTFQAKGLGREYMVEKTGIRHGWSKMLGAPTRDGELGGLEGNGFIKSSMKEGERRLTYNITAKGVKALES